MFSRVGGAMPERLRVCTARRRCPWLANSTAVCSLAFQTSCSLFSDEFGEQPAAEGANALSRAYLMLARNLLVVDLRPPRFRVRHDAGRDIILSSARPRSYKFPFSTAARYVKNRGWHVAIQLSSAPIGM